MTTVDHFIFKAPFHTGPPATCDYVNLNLNQLNEIKLKIQFLTHTSHSVRAQWPHSWWLLYQKSTDCKRVHHHRSSIGPGFSRRKPLYLNLLFAIRFEPRPWKVIDAV